MDQLIEIVTKHPWAAAVLVIFWAELRVLPTLRHDIAWDRAIARKLGVTEADRDAELAGAGSEIPIPGVAEIAKKLTDSSQGRTP